MRRERIDLIHANNSPSYSYFDWLPTPSRDKRAELSRINHFVDARRSRSERRDRRNRRERNC